MRGKRHHKWALVARVNSHQCKLGIDTSHLLMGWPCHLGRGMSAGNQLVTNVLRRAYGNYIPQLPLMTSGNQGPHSPEPFWKPQQGCPCRNTAPDLAKRLRTKWALKTKFSLWPAGRSLGDSLDRAECWELDLALILPLLAAHLRAGTATLPPMPPNHCRWIKKNLHSKPQLTHTRSHICNHTQATRPLPPMVRRAGD